MYLQILNIWCAILLNLRFFGDNWYPSNSSRSIVVLRVSSSFTWRRATGFHPWKIPMFPAFHDVIWGFMFFSLGPTMSNGDTLDPIRWTSSSQRGRAARIAAFLELLKASGGITRIVEASVTRSWSWVGTDQHPKKELVEGHQTKEKVSKNAKNEIF